MTIPIHSAILPIEGGIFLAKSNYVYNFSLESGKTGLFEKESENSISSILLGTDSPGVYLDASNHGLVTDTSKGHIKFRTRFLPTANSGLWQVSAGVVYSYKVDSNNRNFEEESNIFRSKIAVLPVTNMEKVPWKFFRLILLFTIIIIVFCIFVFYMRYKYKITQIKPESKEDFSQDVDFQRIMGYIKHHYAEKIVIKDLLRECHFSKPGFYNVLNKYNKNLPDMVKKYRIEKAKELLVNEKNKNIDEISLPRWLSRAYPFYKGV